MATIDIKASTVVVTEKRAAEICSILAEIGVEYNFKPSKCSNPKKDELLKEVTASVRALRILKLACEANELNWDTVTVSQFANTVGHSDLIKLRNCGKRGLEEIRNILYDHGLNMMI